MGFFDFLKSVNTGLKNIQSEANEWRNKLESKSDQELMHIARNGSPTAKKMGAAMLLKERGYGNQ